MINKIKEFVMNNTAPLILAACALIVLGLGIRSENITQRYETKIEVLEASARYDDTVILEFEVESVALNAELKKVKELNKALVAQLDTKAEQIADVKTYITDTNKTICPDVAGTIAENIVISGLKYAVPIPVIVAVMERESHFNFMAVGGVGERGLMQVRYTVWGKKLDIKNKYDLHNVAIGVQKGVQVLDISLKACKYDLKRAIRQYNSGSTSRGSALYVSNVMKALSEYSAHTSLRQIIKDKQKQEAKSTHDKPIVTITEDLTEVD